MTKIIHALLFALVLHGVTLRPVRANLIVGVTQAPEEPGGYFFSKIVGGDPYDPTPNPCYGILNCTLRLFTIDESWMPYGKVGYDTVDNDPWRTPAPHSTYRTIGAWWSAVMDKDRFGGDYLPIEYGTRACAVVAAANDKRIMFIGTIVSNCAKGIVQSPTCMLLPEIISIYLDGVAGHDTTVRDVPDISVKCDQTSSVKIETNTGEMIPLGGSSRSIAVLDWGRGWGVPGVYDVPGGTEQPVALRIKTEGTGLLQPGVVSGSAIVSVSYN